MPSKKHTPGQIIGKLTEAEIVLAGATTSECVGGGAALIMCADGLDSAGKLKLIEGATAILDPRPDETSVPPVYLVIHQVAEENGTFSVTCSPDCYHSEVESRSFMIDV
jgi:hypothetical protein